MGFLSDLFDPGKGEREAASRRAQEAEFTGGQFTGPAGLGGGISFGPSGSANLTGQLGGFEPFLQALLQQGQQTMGGPAFDPSLRQQDFAGLGQIFGQALPTAMADPFQLGASVADKLRPGLERAQGTLRNTTFSKLFGSGQAAVSGAASPVLEGLQRTFGEQNQALDVAGLDIGRQLQSDAFGRAMGATGGRQSLEQLFMQAQAQQQGLGIQSLGAATGLAQLPLAFQSALMSAGGLRSDSILGGAQTQATIASQARSPFLEALTAAGGLMTGIGAFRNP